MTPVCSHRRIGRWTLGAALALAAVGCGRSGDSGNKKASSAKPSPPGATADATAAAKRAAPPTAFGSITGTVVLTGAAPPMPALNRASDPVCAAVAKNAPFVRVGPKAGLADVVVRLPPGATSTPAPSTPQVIRQHECMYEPYVATVVAGQPIAIANRDKTLHNVQAWSGEVSLFNRAQPPGSKDLRKTFDVKAGDVLRLACNVHTWMAAYVVVTDHDRVAVTTTTGEFKLDRVPAGRYQLEAWHPHFPAQKIAVTVEKDATATVTIRVPAASYVAPR